MSDQPPLIAVLPAGQPRPAEGPARFEAWPDDLKERCFELWSTLGGRNGSRTEWLLGREAEGASIPSASTIRRWAAQENWGLRADDDLEQTRGQTLRQLQTNWLRILQSSQETLADALIGRFDGDPQAGALRLKAAEVGLRVLGQAGALTVAPPPPELSDAEHAALTPMQRARVNRDREQEAKQQAGRRR